MRLRVWTVIASGCLALCFGLSASFTVYWVHRYTSNECAALNDLTSKVPQHAPNHPAELSTYKFYLDILTWDHRDGCR